MNELKGPTLILSVLHVAERMAAHFNCAVVHYRIHHETAADELSAHRCTLPEHVHRLHVMLDAFVVLVELEVS